MADLDFVQSVVVPLEVDLLVVDFEADQMGVVVKTLQRSLKRTLMILE